MLSNKEIICPNNLLDIAHKKKTVTAGIVNAGKPLPMLSVMDAVNENLIVPIFIGDKKAIEKCASDLKWDISQYKLIHKPTIQVRSSAEQGENHKAVWLLDLFDISSIKNDT
mgnify:CR=1 FL=1